MSTAVDIRKRKGAFGPQPKPDAKRERVTSYFSPEDYKLLGPLISFFEIREGRGITKSELVNLLVKDKADEIGVALNGRD